MIQLICCDVDGTLLNKQKEIDLITKEVFNKLIGKVVFVLASSRMPKALFHIQEELSIEDSPLICYNGALVLKSGNIFSTDQILSSSTIPGETVKGILKLARSLDIHASLYYNNTWVASKNDFWMQREINNTKVSPDAIFDNDKEEVILEHMKNTHKIMLMGDQNKINAMESEPGLQLKVSFCRTKETYLEITPRFTNKSKGLYLLINSTKEFNAIRKENIIAFGDNNNDFELLRDVKYGIAVDNATREIKDIAYDVTKSNIENGVACYLKQFMEVK